MWIQLWLSFQKVECDLVLYDMKDIVIFVVGGSQKQKHLTTTHDLIPLLIHPNALNLSNATSLDPPSIITIPCPC